MIDPDAIQSYNHRLTMNLSELNRLTPEQRERVRDQGNRAQRLLQDRDLVQFIHQFRFEVADAIAGIQGHSDTDNSRRVALANHLSGMDQFVAVLQRAVYQRDRAVSQEDGPPAPRDTTKEVYTP